MGIDFKRRCVGVSLLNMCPGCARIRAIGATSKHFVGCGSLGSQHGIVVLRGGSTSVLFKGARARPVKRFIGTDKITCRMMNLCGSRKSHRTGRTCVPFSALRAVCGGKSGLGGVVFAAGGLRDVRDGRTFRGRCHGTVTAGRHFSPASRDTV